MRVIAFFITLPLMATTYYVSPSGSDSNAGTSITASWANAPGMTNCVGVCASTTLSPGDSVLLQANGEWRQTITMAANGNSSSQIIYGAYGNGGPPIISGGSVVSAWTP